MTRISWCVIYMVGLVACGGGSDPVDGSCGQDEDGGQTHEDAGQAPDDSGVVMEEDAGAAMDGGPGDAGMSMDDAGPGDGGMPPVMMCCTDAGWDVTEGVTPDADCVPWALVDSGPMAPSLGSAGLAIATASNAQNQYYEQAAPTIDAGDHVQIRFRMQVTSSSAVEPWRAGTGVLFTFGPSREKNSLYLADGEIFLLSAENVRGMSASVPTSDAMHDYVIDVDRLTGSVSVSYDGTPTLTGNLFINPGDTTTDRILWGEVSNVATGSSVWESFEHDAWSGCHVAAWAASDAVLPDLDCPPWTTVDSAAADPVLSSAGVTVSTASNAENMAYTQTSIAAGSLVRIAFRMRVVSESTSASWRAGAGVIFAFGPAREKNSLYVADGEIFLLSAENIRGMAATVPTSDAMHDYVVEVDRTTGAVTVSYDAVPTLTGSLFVNPGDTTTDLITWGEVSNVATGESIWESFEHDAYAGCL